MNPSFDIFELNNRQGDDQNHQDNGLRGRAAQVQRFKTIVVNLENHDVGGFIGASFSDGMNHPKGVKKSIDDVHDN